jgi:hypothetical protein
VKVLIDNVTLCAIDGMCEVFDSEAGGLSMGIVGAPDEQLEPGQILLMVGPVSVTVDLADALLPFLARIERKP